MRLGQDGRNLSEWIRPWFCGLGSGVMDISITFPINKVMFRQQLNGITSKQAINQLKVEMANMKSLSRIKYMYRGLLPPTFNRCLGRMFTFGGYDSCRRLLSKNSQFKGQKLNFLAALGSGAFEALICCPFERVQTILQDSNNNRRFKNTPEIFRKLPVREYYRGIRPILLRNGPSTFLYFYIYDVSSFWVQIGFGDDFIRGALGGVCATLYGYIFNVIKSRQQSILDPAESTRLKSSLSTLKLIYKERGSFHQLYRGLPFALTRTSLSWGITTICYQRCVSYMSAVS